jgi:hypothetical protein
VSICVYKLLIQRNSIKRFVVFLVTGENVRVLKPLKWKTIERQDYDLKRRIKSKRQKKSQSRDGYMLIAEGMFSYKSFPYMIKVLRYYTVESGFKPIISTKFSDSHAVVEPSARTQKVTDILHKLGDHSEFLWYDTLHSWNEKQDIYEQITDCHNLAKSNIDAIPKIIKSLGVAYRELVRFYGRAGAKGVG